jgi:HD superfamily phosphohydrolase YqeK
MTGDSVTDLDAWSTGTLPGWAEVSAERYEHARRVATLLDRWAAEQGLEGDERRRWRLAGWLHDSLRDAEPERIRDWIDEPALRALPGGFLHGPASASRLAAGGVTDEQLMDAIRYHTLGRPNPADLDLALIAADALEPGRVSRPAWRAALRARMPQALHAVAAEVVGERLGRSLAAGTPLRLEMVALWNDLANRTA